MLVRIVAAVVAHLCLTIAQCDMTGVGVTALARIHLTALTLHLAFAPSPHLRLTSLKANKLKANKHGDSSTQGNQLVST